MITIPIIKEHITTRKRTLIKNSVEEDNFVNEVIMSFSKVDTSNISSISDLDEIVLSWADSSLISPNARKVGGTTNAVKTWQIIESSKA